MIKNILIIEDEKPNADRLKRLISFVNPASSIVGVLESVSESVDWLSKNPCPDLIMMDVRLPDGLSFEIFDKVQIPCAVIFTTAYDEYAVRAFKVNSVDYLLKPIEQEELEQALRVAEQRQQSEQTLSIESLLNHINKKEYRSRFLLPFRDGYKTVLVSDIEYFFSEHKITKAKLQNGSEEVLQQSLEELEEQLDPKTFLRVNRQFIIHIDSITHIHNHFNGKLKIELRKSADVEIIVSREKAASIKSWMDF
ncbi:LytR/AlgR family response regulator transcription factor [Dyadobacter fermentans]|uniref:Two component transcriptional regulator, LytTR family n=1 Tax=Dyadobacter fermentans (strain ATCC 700827 / DSM 18053 / CIP 107007 / KCTC 52180 / NS114) TaxID=471854 RepID=C6W291_DYAFD|nr:LytTR family DNA-binding domain-containing protein [Dyadobacter fermentans]ACT92064.1 two component transcriptional regulator, LytTR family [Dyadobacter fermentans DSM 18053]